MKMRTQLHKKLAGFGFLAAMFMFGTGAVNAQDKGNGIIRGDRAVRFGIKGGVNLSQLDVDPSDIEVDKESWKFGLNGGIFLKAPLNDLFAIQPELLYTSAGSKVEYGVGRNTQAGVQIRNAIRYNLNYIQLPVLASLTLGPISIQAGPYISYLIGVNVKNFDVDNPASPQTIAKPNRNSFNEIDYGLAGGLAVDIKGFQFGARYNYGLRSIGGNGFTETLTNDAKNSVAQAFVAVGF